MKLLKYIFPKSWTETKISENSYLSNIPKEEIERWQLDKWKKDKVNKIIRKDGFYLKQEGRNGTIYFVSKKQLCQIYFETSGVKDYDILVFFEQLNEWQLPKRKAMSEVEIKIIKESLINWLKSKRIKAEL